MTFFPPRSWRSATVSRIHLQRLLGWEPPEFRNLADTTLQAIEGWRYPQDLALLYLLARDVPGGGVTVEIGSYKGLATTALAFGVRHGRKEMVHTVDPHTGDRQALEAIGGEPQSSEKDFKRNLRFAGIEDAVVSYTTTSDELASRWEAGRIRLLFVDGWHSYEAVTSDLRNWVPLLTSGGAALIDDYYNYDEVRAAVEDARELLPPRQFRAGRMRLLCRGKLPPAVSRYLRIPWG